MVPIDESSLTPGQKRKLTTVRKTLGNKIGDKAFLEWLDSDRDTNAELIAHTLWPLVQSRKLSIARGGYLVKRGRGRLVVERANP